MVDGALAEGVLIEGAFYIQTGRIRQEPQANDGSRADGRGTRTRRSKSVFTGHY